MVSLLIVLTRLTQMGRKILNYNSLPTFIVYICLGQGNQEPVPTTNQWMASEFLTPAEFSTCNNYSSSGATSLSNQDNPPTYDAAIANDPSTAGGWTLPS